MKSEINLLILDEPTNHLDLSSREWIEEAVAEYDETLLFISHDRYFINRFATRIWELANGVFTDFEGRYAEYIKQKDNIKAEKQVKGNDRKSRPSGQRDSHKKKPSEAQKELRRLEREIDKLEKELESIKLVKNVFSTDYEKLMELDKQEQGIQEQLDWLMYQWEQMA